MTGEQSTADRLNKARLRLLSGHAEGQEWVAGADPRDVLTFEAAVRADEREQAEPNTRLMERSLDVAEARIEELTTADASLRAAARLSRNTRRSDFTLTSGYIADAFHGEWVLVPAEDFDLLRAALAGTPPAEETK